MEPRMAMNVAQHKLQIYLKHHDISFVITCRSVLNVWPKTILSVWPKGAKRLDTPHLHYYQNYLFGYYEL